MNLKKHFLGGRRSYFGDASDTFDPMDLNLPSSSSSSSLTPAQLAQLDRALTPAEQQQVDDWQAGQSAASEASVESTPTSSGARLQADPSSSGDLSTVAVRLRPLQLPLSPDEPGMKSSKSASGLLLAAIAGGVLLAASRNKKKTRRKKGA